MMKVTKFLPIVGISLMTMGCNSSKTQLSSGIDIANLDTTALPGTSFYQYACGGWMKNNPLKGEYSRYGTFAQLADNNQKELKNLIVELAKGNEKKEGSIAQKVGDLYNIAMDSVKLNKEGAQPIEAELKQLATITDRADIIPIIIDMKKKGLSPYFEIGVGPDDKNSSMNILQFYQGGIGMSNRDYYLENDEQTKKIREGYKEYIKKLFMLTGSDQVTADKAEQAVMNIETRLAQKSRTQVELRSPEANYNKMSIAELKKDFPSFDWEKLFSTAGLKEIKDANICQPEAIKEACNIIKTVPLQDQIYYLQWNLINEAASYLNDDFAKADFKFYGELMSGSKEMRPRWKRAVSTVNNCLGEAVGQMYVKKYFSEAAKARMLALVKNLQSTLGERIKASSWMCEATKAKALEKLAAYRIKIGYPDKWKDYTSLKIQNDTYWANIERANLWDYNDQLSKVNKPVDKTEWQMTPQTVNAYYNPTTNEICFPAGILQPPFFNMNADDACNYGAIGVVIGHEMTHGFDDQGRKYDKDGNMNSWWTKEDAEKFNKRAAVMSNFFDSIQVAPGVHANGEFTLGENIADHGGLQISYQAFEKVMKKNPLPVKEGFTPEQRFFLSYANVWANNIRPAEILRLTKIDPHALCRWRVNGALPQIDAWYKAFNITAKDPMFIPKDKRVSIW